MKIIHARSFYLSELDCDVYLHSPCGAIGGCFFCRLFRPATPTLLLGAPGPALLFGLPGHSVGGAAGSPSFAVPALTIATRPLRCSAAAVTHPAPASQAATSGAPGPPCSVPGRSTARY